MYDPDNTIIIGAGLAGMLAAEAFPSCTIMEAAEKVHPHKALLRFRDESVSNLTRIKFKKVEVHKSIFSGGVLRDRCDIGDANSYSIKTTQSIIDRSIWNLDPVVRYIAPPDFHETLLERHETRIHYGCPVLKYSIYPNSSMSYINTAPLPAIMEACDMEFGADFNFERRGVRVDRYQLPEGTDVYQTVYFPDLDTNIFRASITKDVLIIESMADEMGPPENPHFLAARAFSISSQLGKIKHLDSSTLEYGKIIDLPKPTREAILYKLTREYSVFSLGRFACWRNILLDDVVKDLEFITHLMDASEYRRERIVLGR